MRAVHDRLTRLETAMLERQEEPSALDTLLALIERLASRINPPADPETLELVATGDPLDILESAEACRVASMIAALLANGEDE